mmetsp:Transcript_26857/g.58602  ORF Transcript_26857/g.58602 Transcript_26857/m.58602 type:complete len:282 (-) Transcript_26857:6-851(-)
MDFLDVSKIDKKVWIVKVPNAVAQIWRPLCEKAMTNSNIDEDDNATELGVVNVVAGKGPEGDPNKKQLLLHLNGAREKGLPTEYCMHQLPADTGSGLANVFSYKVPDKEGEEPSQIRAEGTVDLNFNLMPVHKMDSKGQLELDAAYRALSKDRTIRASTKLRTVQRFEDTREERVQARRNFDAALNSKRKAESEREKRLDNKRIREEKGKLEEILFALFERTPHWTFQQLQRETNQPGQYLKEVLTEIAIMNKRGPHKDLYELKREFKGGAAGPDEKEGAA